MAQGTVRVTGLKETIRAFSKLDKTVARELGNELKKAAEPVKEDAERRLSRFRGVGKVRARRRGASVLVEQTARKTTGDHPQFGALQMQEGFIPAAEANESEVLRGVEDALDRFASSAGF